MVNIYALINPINNEVFYIGATINPITRLNAHINNASKCGSKKDSIIYDLIHKNDMEPEMCILDTCSLPDAGFWEIFYTDLYRSYGFEIKKCVMPYFHFDRKKAIRIGRKIRFEIMSPPKNNISPKIDGKDIHYYRREVLKHFNFYQNT